MNELRGPVTERNTAYAVGKHMLEYIPFVLYILGSGYFPSHGRESLKNVLNAEVTQDQLICHEAQYKIESPLGIHPGSV